MKDPYEILGVQKTADEAAIRAAYRKLAKKHHPDVNPGDKSAEERFKRASAAFDILGDAEKRKKFDAGEIDGDGRETARTYQGPFGQGAQAGSPFGAGGGGFGGASFDGVDLNDILGGMFGGQGGGQGGGRAGGFGARGADVRARLDIDLEEAISGAKKRVPFGDGRMLDIVIPKGVAEGQVLRLKGQGSPGRAGAGDALIEIAFRPHPVYRREGDQLVMDLPVSAPDAILGGKIQAETPDGPVTLTVPRGSSSGAILRLKGRGLADAAGRRGDLLARLMITLPEVIDPSLESFAETWRAERPYTPKRKR